MNQALIYCIVFVASFVVVLLSFPPVIACLKTAGLRVKDMHKLDKPAIVEMGGIVIVGGFSVGVAIYMTTEALSVASSVDISHLLAVIIAVYIVTAVGAIDDLRGLRQGVKAILPIIASVPLIVAGVGQEVVHIPFFGSLNFGVCYYALMLPIIMTVFPNAFNMLGGFNGIEIGMGLVACASLSVIAYVLGEWASLVMLLALGGAMVATLRYNWFPARAFVGDTGAFAIGGVIVTAVILGHFELAAIIMLVPFAVDFWLKAPFRFPKTFGEYKDGKLYCPQGQTIGLARWIMKIFGGIRERTLVLVLMGIEMVFGLIAVAVYIRGQ